METTGNFLCIVQIRLSQFSSHGHSNPVIQLIQKVQNTAARLILRAPCHQNGTPLLQQLHWLPISERIKYKTAYLSEILHLYSPSRYLCSSLDTRILKLQRFNRKTHGFHTLAPTSGTISPKTSGILLLSSFKSELISLLRIFKLSNIVLHPYQSAQCVCTCVNICV